MTDPSEWTEADLNKLIQSDVQENLHLDYKQSRALTRTDDCRNELSKDVAAFANSDGGRIIYGIVEKKSHPQEIDEGVNAVELTREWLEQVISSNIQPKIEGLKIYPIPLRSKGADRVGFVIDIPQSKSRAPHQSRDKKYYKRYNFQSVAMDDYEIRDIMRRATTPDLWIKFRFDPGDFVNLDIDAGDKHTAPIKLHAEIGNRSPTPAEHAEIDIYIDRFLTVLYVDLPRKGRIAHNARDLDVFTTRWSVPDQLPIFAEAIFPVTKTINLAIGDKLVFGGSGEFEFWIGYAIRAPGCSVEEFVPMKLQGRTLRILTPPLA